MKFNLVIFVDVVNEKVRIDVHIANRLVRPEHSESLKMMLRQGTPVGHPASDENVLDEKIRYLQHNGEFFLLNRDQ